MNKLIFTFFSMTLLFSCAQTDEGKQAKNIATSVLPNIANSDFIEDENAVMGNYKVIYQFTESKAEEILEFKIIIIMG